jgi:hypothetical protein
MGNLSSPACARRLPDLADERVLDGEELIWQLGCNERGRDDTINAWLSAR